MAEPIAAPTFYSPKEAAALTPYSERTWVRWCAEKIICGAVQGKGPQGQWRIPAAAVNVRRGGGG